MDAFYSSDEDIAWGPVTLREIKGDLKRPVLRKPIRRHTSYCEQTTEIDKMSNIASEDTILEISAYLTASEAASVKNDTQYYSTDENVIKNNSPADVSNSGLDSPLNKLLQGTPLSSDETTDKSHLNLSQNVMDKSSNVIKTEHETLVESPINMNESLYVIEISSEDEQVEKKTSPSCSLETIDNSIINNSYYSEKDCSNQEEYCESESYYKDGDDLPLDQSAISESKYPTTSAITIPDIDLQQFNDSSICPLNDTIEKINAILNQAGDESFTESPIKATHIKHEKNDELNMGDLSISPICKQNSKSNISGNEDNFQTCNLISGSFLQKPISDFSTKKTPTKYQTQINSNFTIKSHIPVPKRSPDTFKVPTLPAQKTKPNLKNIISPVRMYIKYSPRPVLKRNMDSSGTKKLQKPTNSKNKENIDIPSNIVYKPSKNPVLGSERNICMPTSLEKMVVKSTVTRHARNPVSVSLFRKDVSLDQDLELTTNSLNVSQFSEKDENMSVLHKTPAFRK